MAKKYLTPDFDVTSYDIDDILTVDVGTGDSDGMDEASWKGDDLEW